MNGSVPGSTLSQHSICLVHPRIKPPELEVWYTGAGHLGCLLVSSDPNGSAMPCSRRFRIKKEPSTAYVLYIHSNYLGKQVQD